VRDDVRSLKQCQKCGNQDYNGSLISCARDNAVANLLQILRISLWRILNLPTYPLSRQPSLTVHRRSVLFDRAPTSRRVIASVGTAIRRAVVHLLARLAIAATCTNSAAAFDAMHISRVTVATVGGTHSLEPRPVSLVRSASTSQREIEVQGEEEMGTQ